MNIFQLILKPLVMIKFDIAVITVVYNNLVNNKNFKFRF